MTMLRSIAAAGLATLALACAGLPRWSVTANGKLLALIKHRRIHLVDRAGKAVRSFDVPAVYNEPVAVFVAPDGGAVVSACWQDRGDGRTALVLHDVGTGVDREIASGAKDGYLVGDGWSRDGRLFAFAEGLTDDRCPLRVFERSTGRLRTLHENTPYHPTWSRDGAALLTFEPLDPKKKDGRLLRIGLDGKTRSLGEVRAPAWVQEGAGGRLWVTGATVAAGHDPDIDDLRLWQRGPEDGALRQMHHRAVPAFTLSPDGERVAALTVLKERARSIVALRADGRAERTVLEFPQKGKDELVAMPLWLDATTVLCAWEDGGQVKVVLCDVTTGASTDWSGVYAALR